MSKLYEQNADFRRYVDRCCVTYKKPLAEMLENALVLSYAEYLHEESESDD